MKLSDFSLVVAPDLGLVRTDCLLLDVLPGERVYDPFKTDAYQKLTPEQLAAKKVMHDAR